MQVVVDGILTNYTDVGKGAVLVFVHGWMLDSADFDDVARILKKEFRIISVDLPNFGRSQTTDAIKSIADYAKFLSNFIKKLKIKNYVLVGHSMGGQIAIYGAGSDVLQPDKLVLIGSAGVRNEHKIYKRLLKYAAVVVSPVVPVAVKVWFYRLIGSDYSPKLSRIHKNIISRTLTTDIIDKARHISQPTLLIYGALDTSTPVKIGEKINNAIEGSRLEVIENEHHWPHRTSASRVAALIMEFLK